MAIPATVLTPTASTRHFAAAALCAGALAAVALPDNRLGLGMVLVAALVLLAVAVRADGDRYAVSADPGCGRESEGPKPDGVFAWNLARQRARTIATESGR